MVWSQSCTLKMQQVFSGMPGLKLPKTLVLSYLEESCVGWAHNAWNDCLIMGTKPSKYIFQSSPSPDVTGSKTSQGFHLTRTY